jgi:hypothetical protein
MINEANIRTGSIRFRLDGNVKTINRPVTGAALHVLAGNPATLTADGGGAVPNSYEPFELKEDAELHSKHHLGQKESIPADRVLSGGPAGVDPGPPVVGEKPATAAELKEKREEILDEVAAGHGGPYAEHDPAKAHDPAKPAGVLDLPAVHEKV